MHPYVRCATLHGYVGLASSVGLEPAQLLARVGLNVADLAFPDRWVPATAVAQLLELSAAEAGREDFGLQLAQRRLLSTVGPLSVVLRDEPDLRSALDLLIRYEHSYNHALRIALTEEQDRATMAIWLEFGEPDPTRQALELAVGAVLDIVRRLCRPQWQPLAVCFTHPPPRDVTAHRRLLGPSLRFDYEFTGLVFSVRELDSANVLAYPDDPTLQTYARRILRSLPPSPTPEFVERVRELVQLFLPLHRCTMPQVARSLGVTKRTLHRHLDEQQQSFAAIVADTRAGLAERYLATERYTISDVADLLGFGAPSAFSRWFHRRFGVSPTVWRATTRHPAPVGAVAAGKDAQRPSSAERGVTTRQALQETATTQSSLPAHGRARH
jgi:AraC-like DNA-binding protein